MKTRRTSVAAVAAMALGGFCLAVQALPPGAPATTAQGTGAAAPSPSTSGLTNSDLEVVVITGIRASLEKSINAKREATQVVDVVSAEDMGKLPDKNLADALQRLPGVNISKAGAGEGGFSENDRVAIRGTSPSLTQTLINGHTIATGDWFVQDQGGAGSTVGRSVSYALLPSEIADRIVVYKSAQADQIEGGVAGVVDIQTRKPLGFKRAFTTSVTAQAFYNDMPNKADPQLNALVNWKNDSSTFGSLVQLFSEERHERRDGQEFLGYGVIDSTSPLVAAHPDLNGVLYPKNINETLLRHTRIRRGGVADLQWQPGDTLSLDVSGFYSHMHAPSYDTSFLGNPAGVIGTGIPPTSYTVRNNVLVAANFPDVGPVNSASGTCSLPSGGTGGAGCINPGLSDKIYRPFAFSETYFADLTGAYRPTSNLTISTKLGHSRGIGSTPGDNGYEASWGVGGLNYTMNGTSGLSAISWPAPGQSTGNGSYVSQFNDPNMWTSASWHSIVRTVDAENYGQADAQLAIHDGIWESAQLGVRFADHNRAVHWPADGSWPIGGPCATSPTGCDVTTFPAWNGQLYPGNYQNRLNPPPGYSRTFWQIDQNAVYAWQQTYDPALNSIHPWNDEFSVQEKTSAAYAMADIGGSSWHGNFGVRAVRTRESVLYYSSPPAGVVCQPTPYAQFPVAGCDSTGTINYYTQNVVGHTFTDVLPSTNFKFELTRELIARVAVARTLSRPDYNVLTPTPQLDDLALAGTGGNVDLRPVRSTNYDMGLEWYFRPRSLLSIGLFYMDLTSYVELQTRLQNLYNNTYKHFSLYSVTYPVNIAAHDEGVEVAWQQPLWWGFGTYVNFTLADGRTADRQDVYGASKFTGNAEVYWENQVFSARVAYNYRSKYLQGLVTGVPEYDDAVGDLALSLNYKLGDTVTFTFDGLNLNNPTLKSYGFSRDMPIGRYVNGRQYYFGVRLTF